MNILVTGGAGFIGSNLVHYLLGDAAHDLGISIDRLVNLDKLTYAGSPANLEAAELDPRHVLVEGDICDEMLVCELMEEEEIDIVMHLAAESHVDRSIDSPEDFVVTNVLGTFRLLECFRRHVQKSGRSKAAKYGKPIAEGGNCMFLHVSICEMLLVDERAGMPRGVMRFTIEGDSQPGPDNAAVIIPAGVAHALRNIGNEDLIMVYGTSTTFNPAWEGRMASGVEMAPLPADWKRYLEKE